MKNDLEPAEQLSLICLYLPERLPEIVDVIVGGGVLRVGIEQLPEERARHRHELVHQDLLVV